MAMNSSAQFDCQIHGRATLFTRKTCDKLIDRPEIYSPAHAAFDPNIRQVTEKLPQGLVLESQSFFGSILLAAWEWCVYLKISEAEFVDEI